MRYRCQRCGGFIKDKFIFGLLHVCLTDEEVRLQQQYHAQLYAQQHVKSPTQMLEDLLRDKANG